MPLAIADSSNVCAVPRLCSMNAAPKPRPRMETSASVRPSFRRSTGPDLSLADGEAAREIKPAMAPPKRVRRMKSRRELPAFIFEKSLWRNPVSTAIAGYVLLQVDGLDEAVEIAHRRRHNCG